MTHGDLSLRREHVDGEWRVGDGFEREDEEGEFAVVAGDAVGAEGCAAGAAVDDGPFAVFADGDGHGLHG